MTLLDDRKQEHKKHHVRHWKTGKIECLTCQRQLGWICPRCEDFETTDVLAAISHMRTHKEVN